VPGNSEDVPDPVRDGRPRGNPLAGAFGCRRVDALPSHDDVVLNERWPFVTAETLRHGSDPEMDVRRRGIVRDDELLTGANNGFP
jgi:hypothetical protein